MTITMYSRPRLLMLAGVALVLMSNGAGAFNQSGHMETIRLVVEKSLFALDRVAAQSGNPLATSERQLTEYCAQLPDLSQELSAPRVYERAVGQWSAPVTWISWGWFDHPMNDDYKRMVAVQQILHALTGGDASAMRRVALSSARKLLGKVSRSPRGSDRTVDICALGLAFHLFGDTFAHTQMAWNDTDRSRSLYPTGRGHGFDGHFPDFVLCNFLEKSASGYTNCHPSDSQNFKGVRFQAWIAYWTRAGPALTDASASPVAWDAVRPDPVFGASSADLADAIRDAALAVRSGKDVDLSMSIADDKIGVALRKSLLASLEASASADALTDALDRFMAQNKGGFLSSPSCTHMLEGGSGALGLGDTAVAHADNCKHVWESYSAVVLEYLRGCVQPPVTGMPECTSDRKPVDAAWEKWLTGGELKEYAALVRF